MDDATLERDLGARLRQLRLHANLSQGRLAERAGISPRALRNLEHGEGSTVGTLLCVLRALGCADGCQVAPPASDTASVAEFCRYAIRERASSRRTRPPPTG